VHGREVVAEGSPRIVFPGNLQGRHANECGAKGCELVTVELGVMSAEFMPLDVVRWSQVDVDLSGAESLDAVAVRFHAAIAPCLDGATELLHAMRVTVSGASALHDIEAMTPGTLAAAIQGAAQDVDRAQVWIEQVRLSLTAPLDRAQAAARQDAVGELVRFVDAVVGDDDLLARFADEQLKALTGSLSAELLGDELENLRDPVSLRLLMLDGEATVLARMAAAVAPANKAVTESARPKAAARPAPSEESA